MKGLRVAKWNKRLLIVDENDIPVYIPPHFLRDKITSRDHLGSIIKKIENGDVYIDVIREFETSLRPEIGE